MAGTVRFILIGCLLQGVLSSQFQIPAKYENDLQSAKAVLIRGKKWQDGNHVFDSNKTQSENRIQGRLIGDLLQKNCTIIMDRLTTSYADHYSFRIDSMGPLKFTFNKTVPILVTDSPPKPKLTPEKVEVTEGTSVSLTCSAAAPCPKLPPTLTWTPRLRNSVDQLQENEDQTKSVSSVLTFTASHLLHGQKISCTALYKLQQGDGEKKSEQSLTVSVLYPPKSTSASVSPSGSVMLGSSVTLTCSSNANPPVQSYTWYKVNGKEMKTVGSGQNLTFNVTEPSDGGQYYCEAQNDHGRQRSPVFVNTQTADYPEKQR
ncbi:myelin-associated glycoprotein-like [Megalops cyprinoides]|uniref:myelin-associated glycoprotein-like n=1 Tax=Megalops cyprinoides TaxID=118141 RepID=UPI001864EFDB|nr:myelin-associated glycoprotein-like [Megalops cyprinoides]